MENEKFERHGLVYRDATSMNQPQPRDAAGLLAVLDVVKGCAVILFVFGVLLYIFAQLFL